MQPKAVSRAQDAWCLQLIDDLVPHVLVIEEPVHEDDGEFAFAAAEERGVAVGNLLGDRHACGSGTRLAKSRHGGCGAEAHRFVRRGIRERMSGNICRCGAYPNIVAAIRDVAGGASE